MSERTPLRSSQNDQEAFYEDYGEEEHLHLSFTSKLSLFLGGIFITVLMLYLLLFYLPNKFIPEATDLRAIPLVTNLNVTFEVLDPERVEELGLESSKSISDNLEFVDDSQGSNIAKSKKIERLILIGDVHGHFKEFKKLLKKIKYNHKLDHILLLGDFISKGPDSIKMLDYMAEHQLDCILGNHEYYVLQNYAIFHHVNDPFFTNNRSESLYTEGYNDDPEYQLAKRLQPEHVNYINNCSVIKRLGKVPLHKKTNMGGFNSAQGVAVHAGLRWDLGLEDQIPIENLEMRSLVGPFFNQSTDDPHEPNAVSWSKIYNGKQKLKKKGSGRVVYYGHDARRGLSLKKYTKGIDTGCDRGERLTALVIWQEAAIDKKGRKRVLYKEEPISVSC